MVVTGYGIISRILKSAVDECRLKGIKVGLLRPITLFPFPTAEFEKVGDKAKHLLVVELSNGQYVQDVKLAVGCRKAKVHFYNRMGGMVPTVDELVNEIVRMEGK